MSIHTQGKLCSDLCQVLVLNDPVRVLKDPPAPGFSPNARTFNGLINAAAKARDLPAAKAALAQLDANGLIAQVGPA